MEFGDQKRVLNQENSGILMNFESILIWMYVNRQDFLCLDCS